MNKKKQTPSFVVSGGATTEEHSDSIVHCKCPTCGKECYFSEEFVSFLIALDGLINAVAMLPIHSPCNIAMEVIAYKDPEKGYWLHDKEIDSFLDRAEKRREEM